MIVGMKENEEKVQGREKMSKKTYKEREEEKDWRGKW